MPTKKQRDMVDKMKKEGKTPSQQAGEFVREEIEKIRDKLIVLPVNTSIAA